MKDKQFSILVLSASEYNNCIVYIIYNDFLKYCQLFCHHCQIISWSVVLSFLFSTHLFVKSCFPLILISINWNIFFLPLFFHLSVLPLQSSPDSLFLYNVQVSCFSFSDCSYIAFFYTILVNTS